jgi:hypothetical protein
MLALLGALPGPGLLDMMMAVFSQKGISSLVSVLSEEFGFEIFNPHHMHQQRMSWTELDTQSCCLPARESLEGETKWFSTYQAMNDEHASEFMGMWML